jgi:hypothetical protein
MSDMVDVEFPTGSVLHFLPGDMTEWAPEPTWWMIRKTEGAVWVDHVTEFTATHGKTTPVTGSPTNFIRKFHQKFPSLKKVINLDVPLGSATSTIVINHALGMHFVKYQSNRFLDFQRNQNLRDNIFAKVKALVEQVDRPHFIPLKMPTSFPSLGKIQRAEKEMGVEEIKLFGSLERLMFLEVWKWLGDPTQGIIATLDQSKLHNVNFVFMVRGNWYFANLATLGELRKEIIVKTKESVKAVGAVSAVSSEESTEEVAIAGKVGKKSGKYEPVQLQKHFLNGLIDLIEAGVVAEKKQPLPLDDGHVQNDQSQKDPLTQAEIQTQNEATLSRVTASKEVSGKYEQTPKTLANIGVDNSQATTKQSVSVEEEASAKEQAVLEAERSEALSRNLQAGKVTTELTDEEIDANLEALDRVDQIQNGNDFATPHNPNTNPLEEGILAPIRARAKDGLISGAELRRGEALAVAYKKIKNPYGSGLLHEAAVVKPEELVVTPAKYKVKGLVLDESMLESSVREINKTYVQNTMHKDLVNSVLHFQKSGMAVVDYNVNKSRTVLGAQDITSARFQPVDGAPSTVRFMTPVIDDEGVFKAGGTRYRSRFQRVDVPIRKVKPSQVSLTSYYGKISVTLSDKEVHNYPTWLGNQLSAMDIDKKGVLKDVHFTNVFDREFKSPKTYSLLAHKVHSMRIGDLTFNFRHQDRLTWGLDSTIAALEKDGGVVCGIDSKKQLVLMDRQNKLSVNGQPLGTIEELLGLDLSAAPHQMAIIRVRGQNIPLGVVMASYHGLTNLIAMLKATTRRVLAGDRANLERHEYPVRFSDETLVLDTREPLAMMLLSGFRYYHKQIRQISIYSFDTMSAYSHLLDANSRNGTYTVELDLLDKQFVDPMTERTLIEMGEPTTWRGLLTRSAELLLTDYSPEEVDGDYMLYKGYERVAGAVYKELVVATRQYKLRSRVTKAAMDMKPTAVWNVITGDSATSPINDCNPIADLRASEAVTYIGTGGRSKRSMVARTRKMHKNDRGTIGEATVDSGDVGINVYFSANPRIVNTGGKALIGDPKDMGVSSMVSTSAMLAPAGDIDDPKRLAFVSIMHGSGIAAVGYRTMPYGTNYEDIIPHRVGKKFCYVARGAGVVTSLKAGVMKVTYADGSIDALEVGRVFTSGEGHTYPNDLITLVKAGDTFIEGDCLVYNKAFFEESPFESRAVMYKHGVPCTIALYESVNTLEDSSMISERVSKAMRAYETEIRDVVIDFKVTLHTIAQEGETVEPDDILCTMEDPTSQAADLFSEEAVESLQLLADKSPSANLHGVIDKIEILYNGELEDMSPSLRKLVEESDRKLRNRNRDLGDPVESGRADETLRIRNQPLQMDTMTIRFYISHGRDAFAGDKGVVGNQMKTVFGQVMGGTFETESGQPLDMVCSDKGIEDRIVRSARKAGMMNSLLMHTAKKMVAAYRGA